MVELVAPLGAPFGYLEFEADRPSGRPTLEADVDVPADATSTASWTVLMEPYTRSAEVAVVSMDVVLLATDPRSVPSLVRSSRKSHRKVQ